MKQEVCKKSVTLNHMVLLALGIAIWIAFNIGCAEGTYLCMNESVSSVSMLDMYNRVQRLTTPLMRNTLPKCCASEKVVYWKTKKQKKKNNTIF